MTTLLEQVHDEVLRYVYVFWTSRWPAALAQVALGAVAAAAVLAATRLRIPSSRARRPATQERGDS